MKCSVQNCSNDDTKETNKSHGITFHKLPKYPNQSAVLSKVLSRTGCHLTSGSVVCSEHFQAEDSNDSQPHQRRIKSGAVPITMAPDNQSELKVCRVCLALDVKMYDMKGSKLSEMFGKITGISACSINNSSLHHVCWECATRLKAAAAFRDKALLSNALLQNLVDIKKSDIESIKANHNTLKSSLIIQKVFYIARIEYKHSDDEDLKERKTKISINDEDKETAFNVHEPWIDVPIKTEVESDPIADNNINIELKDTKTEIFLEVTRYDNDSESPRENNECKRENTKVQNNNNDTILSETKVPMINDEGNIVLDNKDRKRNIDVIVDIVNVSVSEEDDTAEISVNKAKKKPSGRIKTTSCKAKRINKSMKEKIITLKKRGVSVPKIAEEMGMTPGSIHNWWHRHINSRLKHSRSSIKDQDEGKVDQGEEQQTKPVEIGTEREVSTTVRQRLHEAGLEHILMNAERTAKLEQRESKYKADHEVLKQQIIALKEEGVSARRIAYLLGTTRNTVKKWWGRWCDKGHINNRKNKGAPRKTTAEEDQRLIDRVAQEQTVHTPSLAKELGISAECVRNRLREAGFKHMERKASLPLRSGRSHKVDEVTKQQIISLKQNGVSVTDIANQFRVTRTSVYLWWRRWCTENNINITSDNRSNATIEKDSSATETEIVKEEMQTSSLLLSSQKTLWHKSPEVEFISHPVKSEAEIKVITEKRNSLSDK